MNEDEACHILGIDPDDEELTTETIKRQFRYAALRFHPDKNRGCTEAAAKFQQAREAYDVLMCSSTQCDDEDDDPSMGEEEEEETSHTVNYKHLLVSFLRSWWSSRSPEKSNLIYHVTHLCESQLIEWLKRNTTPENLLLVQQMIQIYNKDVFSFSQDFLDSLTDLIADRTRRRTVTLTPSLDDLHEEQVYRLVVDDVTYWVPLWHHELTYDHLEEGEELFVLCIPQLANETTLWIDSNNNVHCKVSLDVREGLLEKGWWVKITEIWSVWVEAKRMKIDLIEQEIRLVRKGIPIPLPGENALCGEEKGDVVVWVTLK